MRPEDIAPLLARQGLDPTPNRVAAMEIVARTSAPLTAQEIHDILSRTQNVNRVTVYRILDLLVAAGLVERISAGDRTWRYGMGARAEEDRHPHFYCTNCGTMECLNADSIHLDTGPLERTFAGRIDRVEIRVDGICRNCLRSGHR